MPQEIIPVSGDGEGKGGIIANQTATLTRTVKYLYDHQGLTALEVLSILHGVESKVLSWGFEEQVEREVEEQDDEDLEASDEEDSDDDEVVDDDDLSEGGCLIPKKSWTPKDDLEDPNDPDDQDIPDQGDPRKPVPV